MRIVTELKATITKARGFVDDRRGVTAITFALCAMVLLAATFAAIDGARLSAARVELQDALDAATLAAGVSTASDSVTVNKIGSAFMTGQLKNNANLQGLKSTFTPTSAGVSAVATADVDPIFMDLFTGQVVHLSVASEVKRGAGQTLEIALVLDTTGSMSGAKITGLKTAAVSLVTKVMTGHTNGEVKVGVVPFANYVNMGIASRSEAWAAVPADYSTTSTSTSTPSCNKTTCTTQTYACTQYNDGAPYQTTCSRSINCTTVKLNPCPGPVTTTSTSNYKFQGCYGSPPYPQNVRDSDAGRKYPGFLNLSCSKQVTPLSTNQATVTAAINALSASGNTYIPAGLTWGFNMLSPQAPLTDAAAYDTAGPNNKPRKVMILMTDGANTKLMRTANGDHEGNPATGARAVQADQWTTELCDNIKAQKIELYTVAFDIGSDTVSRDLVRTCATDAAHFYDAADSAALLAAFQDIGAALSALHISN